MKGLLIIVVLVGCVGLHADQKKDTSADMTTARKIFIGWVNIGLDDWVPLGYQNQQAWSAVIDWNNQNFQRVFGANLPGREITGAKSRSDENISGHTWG